MKHFIFVVVFLLIAAISYSEQLTTPEEILKKAVEKAKEGEQMSEKIGFYQDIVTRELKDAGNVDDEESRTYRTTWIENEAYPELVAVDGKPPNSKQEDQEEKRRKKFIESLHDKKKKDDDAKLDFTWEELSKKFKFTMRPAESDAAYVMNFEPRNDDLPERNRVERVINHLHGRVWLDQDCNLLKAEAELGDSVHYGFGILGSIDELKVIYAQQKYRDLFVPASFQAKYKARILVKTLRKEVDSKFYDMFERPQSEPAQGH